mgnify:CR=1 FL=1
MFSVIIPTHNEEKRIYATLARLLSFLRTNYAARFEVIVIDDGIDSTEKIVSRFAAQKKNNLSLRHFSTRIGKGGAIMKGIRFARGQFCITYDADAAVPPKEIPGMLDALKSSDIVVGSRAVENAVIVGRVPLRRRFASRAFSLVVGFLFRLGVRDTQCGFKGFRRKRILPLLPRLHRTGFEWDVELLVKAKKAGLRLKEIPVEWHHKKEGKVVLRDVGRMLEGVLALKREIG